MKATESIAHEIARRAAMRVAKRTIRYLQSRKDCTLSGDDSELENVWDEICVQVQSDESFFWEEYKETVSNIVAGYVEELPSHERLAIWLDTNEGQDWQMSDDAAAAATPPVLLDEVVYHIAHEYVLDAAGSYSNAKIREFIDRSNTFD